MKLKLLLTVIIVVALSASVKAQEFRSFDVIATPETEKMAMPDDIVLMDVEIPLLPRQTITKVVNEFVEEWNNPGMREHISDDLFNKTRLMDNMAFKVPRYAKLRLMSIQGVQWLSQYATQDETNGLLLIYMVSVTLDTQNEFNDPERGFQRIRGITEVFFKITMKQKG